MNYIDHHSSYEDLIQNAKLSFNDKNKLEMILMDAIFNQTYDDYKWAIKECYLQLKDIIFHEGWNEGWNEDSMTNSL